MRKVLSAIAILAAALGVVWLVRLDRSAPATRFDRHLPTAQDGTAVPAPRPASTLGRIGGKLPDVLVDPKLLAEKSRRTLTVFSAGRPVKTYRIALGKVAIGDKEREGDFKTPEGDFYVCVKNASSKFHRSLGLSYPDAEDAQRGVESGLISKREQRAIVEAVRHYRQPPWGTGLGGEIMIHGGGTGNDWTTGCIALSDADVDELFGRIGLGTPVEVRP